MTDTLTFGTESIDAMDVRAVTIEGGFRYEARLSNGNLLSLNKTEARNLIGQVGFNEMLKFPGLWIAL